MGSSFHSSIHTADSPDDGTSSSRNTTTYSRPGYEVKIELNFSSPLPLAPALINAPSFPSANF